MFVEERKECKEDGLFFLVKKKYDEHGDEEDEDSYMFLDFSYEGDECIWINFILFYD